MQVSLTNEHTREINISLQSSITVKKHVEEETDRTAALSEYTKRQVSQRVILY